MEGHVTTSERLFKVFANITLYRHQTPERVWYEITPLSWLHRRILRAMGMPETIYSTLSTPLTSDVADDEEPDE